MRKRKKRKEMLVEIGSIDASRASKEKRRRIIQKIERKRQVKNLRRGGLDVFMRSVCAGC
jgi:hypothetical protein